MAKIPQQVPPKKRHTGSSTTAPPGVGQRICHANRNILAILTKTVYIPQQLGGKEKKPSWLKTVCESQKHRPELRKPDTNTCLVGTHFDWELGQTNNKGVSRAVGLPMERAGSGTENLVLVWEELETDFRALSLLLKCPPTQIQPQPNSCLFSVCVYTHMFRCSSIWQRAASFCLWQHWGWRDELSYVGYLSPSLSTLYTEAGSLLNPELADISNLI